MTLDHKIELTSRLLTIADEFRRSVIKNDFDLEQHIKKQKQAHDILFKQGIYVHNEQYVLIIPLTDVCYLLIDGEVELKQER